MRGVFVLFRIVVRKISENLNLYSILQRYGYYGTTLWPSVRTRLLGRRKMRIFNNFKVKGVQQPRQDQTAH